MAKIDDQKIMIWCNNAENIRQTIMDAVYFALKLEKEICLLSIHPKAIKIYTIYKKMPAYINLIKSLAPECKVSTLMLEGELHNKIGYLGEKHNVILFCTSGTPNNKLLKAFYRSGFPFYFSKANNNKERLFKKILIPVDFRNSTKDATLWGSYLGRFNQSEIVLLKANETDLHQKKQVESIIAFVKKFYDQFFFNFWVKEGESSSWGIHYEAIKQKGCYDLVIFTGSLNVTWIDRLIGTFETRLIRKSNRPVLLINPQKEMYVLCS